MAVSLSVANDHARLPLAYQLYLPGTWAGDPERRAKAGVPEEIGFATKPEIALAQIRQALEEEVPPGIVLGDAGYGVDTAFRWAIAGLVANAISAGTPALTRRSGSSAQASGR